MKKLLFVISMSLLFIVVELGAQTKESDDTSLLSFDYGLYLESKPYAPFTGTTIGETPAVIPYGSVTLLSSQTNFTYLKSFDLIGDDEGSYDGFFLTQPFKIGNQKFKVQAIHFADFNFKKNGLSAFALEAYGGNRLRWSVQLSESIFHSSSPLWILNPSLGYKNFLISSWTYYESDQFSQTFGVQYTSPSVRLSEAINAKFYITYNTTVTDEGYGQSNTAMIGVTLSPSTKKEQ